jgi:beta-galactosidase
MKLGVCYYPEQWDPSRWPADAAHMAALGLRVVRIGEFAWARMEPQPGRYEWAWLDQAIGTLAAAGLSIVLGTPTAAPPRWLVAQHPDLLPVDAQGRSKGFGSRRHYCFSSEAFFEASRGIVTAMAQRYGRHPAVIAWQTDNEYGCHDTVLSYSPAALRGFRRWLAARYDNIGTLNRRWGNAFWSMDYAAFDEIGLPVALPAQANPIHALDFRRFASDEVLRFNRMQVQVLREHSPGRDVLHNFMGFFGEFDHHEMARDLDVAAWDSYPLGFTDSVPFLEAAERLQWARSGHPDIAAFHHDLYRGLCGGRWWVMEQQAGPVNWAAWNPAPLPGMVRAWTWEAWAHGAELVSYFRWRQLPYAQEQMHSGLHRSDDQPDQGGLEVRQVAGELAGLQPWLDEQPATAPVALVLDYPSKWMLDLQRHGADFDYHAHVFAWYGALRRLGLDVDIVPAGADLGQRALVLVPTLAVADTDFAARLLASGAQVVLGPRSGAKTEDFAIPHNLPPGALGPALGLRVARVESLRPGLAEPVWRCNAAGARSGDRPAGQATRWRDVVEADAGTQVEASFADGHPAVLRRGRLRYLAGAFDAALLAAVLAQAARDAGLAMQPVDGGLRLRRRGTLQFAINYGPSPAVAPAPAGARFVLGSRDLPPAGVAAWEAPQLARHNA